MSACTGMIRLLDAIRMASERRRVERVLAALHARNLMVLAVCWHGRYVRVYVDHKYGLVVLTPRAAERYIRKIEQQEFERALAR